MIPASQASRRAWAAEIRVPSHRVAAPMPRGQELVVDGDHDGGVDPARGGELVGGVALEQLTERGAEQLGVGPFAAGVGVQPRLADPAGCGQCLECLLEDRGVQVGELEGAGVGAVAVVAQGQAGPGGRAAFLLLELLALAFVGGGGVEDLEDPAAQDPQGLGVDQGGLGDQVRLGQVAPGRVEVGGQVVHGGDDHPGVLDTERSRRRARGGWSRTGRPARRRAGRPRSPRPGRGGWRAPATPRSRRRRSPRRPRPCPRRRGPAAAAPRGGTAAAPARPGSGGARRGSSTTPARRRAGRTRPAPPR